jgi:hypothetical protein
MSYMEQTAEPEFHACLAKQRTLHEAVKLINSWLDGHKLDRRYERNRDIRNQIELWADNLWEYGQIEQPEDFADCPESMSCCDR